MRTQTLRLVITVGALLLAVAHIVWPHVEVDAVTVTLTDTRRALRSLRKA